LARRTGHLVRFIVFGSYVTAKPDPNDVDVVLIMDDEFRLELCPPESRALFDHGAAQRELGASIFWMRPAMLLLETVDDFIAHWQRTRDGGLRGIVEVTG
jgi:hypothetical protein